MIDYSSHTEEYLSRTRHIVSPALREKKVAIIGCGAGSYMAIKLARCASPAQMILVDFDHVEWANLSRTAYTVGDVGKLKVIALKDRISEANPFVGVESLPIDFCAANWAEYDSMLEGVDLIVAGTDQFAAQAKINRVSQELGTPAVFIGIHAGAEGGRVIWSLPGKTACYRCVAAERYNRQEADGEQAVNLDAAHGLLPDVQYIDMLALKVCVAILDRDQNSAMGRFFADMSGRNEIIIRCSPEYEHGSALWDAILADLPTAPKPYADEIKREALFSMDTIWLSTERNPDCPDCNPHR